MKVFKGFDDPGIRHGHVSIGNFDGVHRGHQAMLRALRYIHAFRGGEPRPWLFGIVRNAWVDLRARGGLNDRPLDEVEERAAEGPDPEHQALAQDRRRHVAAALAALPAEAREILVLREIEDLAYRDIAEVLGLPVHSTDDVNDAADVPGNDVTAYRLVNSEADGLSGLTVDRYQRWLSVQFTSLALARRRDMLTEVLRELLHPAGILLRTEKGMHEAEGLELSDGLLDGESPPRPFTIFEHGLTWEVDLTEGQKTGSYLDQRDNRRAVARFVSGHRVLDVFCYAEIGRAHV